MSVSTVSFVIQQYAGIFGWQTLIFLFIINRQVYPTKKRKKTKEIVPGYPFSLNIRPDFLEM